ncbi:MAG: tetratricopeptide repeat protein [Pyrinomonadaceae bacterium]|nr:tetratricopeptide repeat protein [Pyrinomonadaceae bacterium]
MRPDRFNPPIFWIRMFAACAALMLLCVGASLAQEAGGDLGGGAIVFRPRNPETSSKRRTNPNRGRTNAGRVGGGRSPARPNNPAAAAELEEQYEDLLDEGNEARDDRKYAQAETAYKQAQQLKPKDWRAAYGLGNIYTDQQRWEEADIAYRQAMSFNALSADTFVALSYVLVQPRSAGNAAKRLTESEQFARRAIQLQPNNAIAYDRLGEALVARALLNAEAEASYRKAVELDPQFAVAYVHLARLMKKTNRASDAEQNFVRAVGLAKEAPQFVLIAEAMQSEQLYIESQPVLARALQLDRRNPSANFLMAKFYIYMRQFADAEGYLKTTIEVSPRSFAPHYVLGSLYLRMERPEDAERAITRAAEVASPNDRRQLAGSYGFGGIGDAYMKAGRKTDAVRAYERAISLDPSNTELQSKLAAARG